MTEFSQLIFLIILLSDLLARFCNSNFYLNPGQMGYPWAKDLFDMQIDFKLWWQSKNLMKRRYVEGFSYLIGIISNYISILYTRGLTKVHLILKRDIGVFKIYYKNNEIFVNISALASKKCLDQKIKALHHFKSPLIYSNKVFLINYLVYRD